MALHGRRRILLLLGLSVFNVALVQRFHPVVDPATVWGDHIFYWSQATNWWGLDQSLLLTEQVQFRLNLLREDYYYDSANGLDGQPPYIYRVFIPLLAGFLGHFLDLGMVFRALSLASLLGIAFLGGLAVLRLSRSFWPAVLVAGMIPWIPGLARLVSLPPLVDLEAILAVSASLFFLVTRRFSTAIVIAAAAPFIKETLLALPLSVAFCSYLLHERRKSIWVIAGVSTTSYGLFRFLLPVIEAPSVSELFVLGNPFAGTYTFINVFSGMPLILLGLVAANVRPLVLGYSPLFLSIYLINSSEIAAADRIWLTVSPLVVALGASGAWQLASCLLWRLTWFFLTVLGYGALLVHNYFGWPRQVQLPIFLTSLVWVVFLAISRSSYIDAEQET